MQLKYICTSDFEYNQIENLDIETIDLGISKFIAHTPNIRISQETTVSKISQETMQFTRDSYSILTN